VAIGNTVLTIAHALLSDPAADYKDLGPDYYDKLRTTAAKSPTTYAGRLS